MSNFSCGGPDRGVCPRRIQVALMVEAPCKSCPSHTNKAGLYVSPSDYNASDRGDGADTVMKG